MADKQPDWERIEQLFRAGVLSLRDRCRMPWVKPCGNRKARKEVWMGPRPVGQDQGQGQ